MRSMFRWIATLLIAGLPTAVQAAPETIKVGAFLSVTGPASFLGDPAKKALELYIDDFNKQGGVLGHKIELILYDDGAAPDKATSFVKRLIENDKVHFIIGGSTTATTMATIPLIEQGEVPFISMAAGVSIVEPVKKWVFKTPQTDRMAAHKILTDVKNRGANKIAILSEDVGFGKSARDQTVLAAPQYGVEVVGDYSYGSKDADMTVQLTKIRNTPGVGAVLILGVGQNTAIATKNYRQLGITVPLYQSHGNASKAYIKMSGDAAEGVRLPAAGLIVTEQLPASDPSKPTLIELTKRYEGTYKSEISTFAGHAYDALQIALAAVKRAGSLDRGKIRDEIEKTSGFIGTAGAFNMSPTDHNGLDAKKTFHMVEIRNGDWKLVE